MYESEFMGENRLSSFLYLVYGLMSGGLALTGVTAYYVSTIPNITQTLFGSPLLVTGIIILQLGLVIGLSFALKKLSFEMALTMFALYSITVGITLSSIFLIYTTVSIVQTIGVTAGMFGIMAVYGYITGTDLSKIGNVAMMGLWGIIIAMLVNLWLQNPVIDLVFSAVGALVFAALTAYDTQKIKQMGTTMMTSGQMMSKVAVLGALTLYLDFINLFLFLLRFMGRRRN